MLNSSCPLFCEVVKYHDKKPSYCKANCFVFQYESSSHYFAKGELWYDAESQRVRFIEKVDFNSTEKLFDNLFLYQQVYNFFTSQDIPNH